MPLRGDFEFQYDNEAENLLAEMEFFETDTPSERQGKFKIISVYEQRVKNRNLRKQFVIQRGVLQAYNPNSNQIGIGRADGVTDEMRNIFGDRFINQNEGMIKQLQGVARVSSC